MTRTISAILGAIMCVVFFSTATLAQVPLSVVGGDSGSSETGTAELPDPLTPEAIDALVARMSDAEVRDMLLGQLEANAVAGTAEEAPKGFVGEVGDLIIGIGLELQYTVQKVPLLLVNQSKSFANFFENYGGMTGVLTLFALIAVALAAGFAVERLVIFLTRNWQGDDVAGAEDNLWGALRFLFFRMLREVIGLIGFYIGLRIVGRLLLDPHQLAFAAPFVVYLIWIPRLTACFARMVLAPNRPDLRLVSVPDKWAKYLHRNLVGLVLMGGFTLWIIQFNAGNGIAMGETRLGFWLNTAVHIYVGLIAWIARDGLAAMMRGTDPDNTPADEWAAWIYPYFAVGVSAVMWIAVQIAIVYKQFGLLVTAPHYTTMFWLTLAPLLDAAIRGLVRHLQPPMIGEGPVAERAYKSTKRSFIRIGRVIMAAIVVIMIANAWQVDLISLRGQESAGADFFQFLITLAIGYVVFEGIALWVNRRLAREQTTREVSEDEAAGEGGGGAGNSRLATVLPLVRVTAQSAVAVIFLLLALGNLGIDTTPLLAGAGILGLAIGFGAQKLVSDIVGGVFFLIDDAFRVGEYIDVGGTAGTVEKISIRSMQLRHHRGAVHTIPYGEIAKLTNYSRDWVIMKLMFTVPFDTDPNKIKKIFKKIGAEMMADPVHSTGFLEPFKSQGVFSFDDVGMVVRGKFMAKPGTQFTIRKEIYNRVIREFETAGIDFARREVRVAIPGMENSEDLSDFNKAAAAGGAAAAIQAATETKA